jgi:hypothetical protein
MLNCILTFIIPYFFISKDDPFCNKAIEINVKNEPALFSLSFCGLQWQFFLYFLQFDFMEFLWIAVLILSF